MVKSARLRCLPVRGWADGLLDNFLVRCTAGHWTVSGPRDVFLPTAAEVLQSEESPDHHCSSVHGKILRGIANGIYHLSSSVCHDRMCMSRAGRMSFLETEHKFFSFLLDR